MKSPPPTAPRAERTFALLVTACWVCLCAIVLVHHEMWRDEIQAWLIVRDSTSLADLAKNLRYEGHPGLWHLCLYALRAAWDSPHAMQAMHLLIGAGSVYIVCSRAPFDRLQKLLFPFGYFTFYEYAVIARSYAMSALLLFALCVVLRGRALPRRRPERDLGALGVGLMLCLLANTNLFGLMLTGGLMTYIVCEARISLREREPPSFSPADERLVVCLALVGATFSALQIVPGAGVPGTYEFTPVLGGAVPALVAWVGAFFPLSEPGLEFWGELRWHGLEWVSLGVVIGALSLGHLVAWRRHAAPRLFLVVTSAGMLTFFGWLASGSLRHHGFIYLAFIAALWLSNDIDWRAGAVRAPGGAGAAALRAGVTLLLAIQVVPAAAAALTDYRHPFSNGKAVAAWLRDAGMERAPVLAYPTAETLPVLGYLPPRQFHRLQEGRSGSFVRWNARRVGAPSVDELACIAARRARIEGRDLVLLVSSALSAEDRADSAVEELATFRPSIVADERFHLYLIRYAAVRGGACESPDRS